MKRIQSGWKIIILFLVILIMGRIIYVNVTYPKTVVQYYQLGDPVEFHGFEIVCQEAKVYESSKFKEYAAVYEADLKQNAEQNENQNVEQNKIMDTLGNQEAYIYVVSLNVKNTEKEEQQFQSKKATLCIGNSLNGSFNTNYTSLLNGGEVKFDLQPGESKDIQVVYHVIKNAQMSDARFERIESQECSVGFLSFYQLKEIRVGNPQREEN